MTTHNPTRHPVSSAALADGPSDGDHDDGAGEIVGNVGQFAEHILTLGELQARLALIEVKQNLEAARTGIWMLSAGAIVALGSLPVLLESVAELLVSGMGIQHAYALLWVCVPTITIACACIAVAVGLLRRAVVGLPTSTDEFHRNLNWVRTVLTHSGRGRPRR
jgi:hypothetical protein